MAVYIFEENAFEKIMEVEGEEYLRFKSEEVFGPCSFDSFLDVWAKNYAPHAQLKNFRPRIAITGKEGNGSIYGFSGWNRYLVLNDGELSFHPGFATEEGIEKAKKAGFCIFGPSRIIDR